MSDFVEHWHGQARACAKGHKQLAFVNELLGGESYCILEAIPGKPWMGRVPVYGTARLEARSYKNLEKRLNQDGFQLVMSDSKVLNDTIIRLI